MSKEYRIFGHLLTERQAKLLASKEDLINYARELTGRKRADTGAPGIPEDMSSNAVQTIVDELDELLDEIEKYET